VTERIDFVAVVAARKSGVRGWEAFKCDDAGNDNVVQGGVPRELTKGPRKGKKVWSGSTSTVVVTQAEVALEKLAYASRTGKCAECCGTGRRMVRWSSADGPRHEKCRTCGGTGKATQGPQP
jgi:hypothetical protein